VICFASHFFYVMVIVVTKGVIAFKQEGIAVDNNNIYFLVLSHIKVQAK